MKVISHALALLVAGAVIGGIASWWSPGMGWPAVAGLYLGMLVTTD